MSTPQGTTQGTTQGLCQYRDVFGKPDQGAHRYRIPIINLAAVDVIGTLLIAYLIYRWRGQVEGLSSLASYGLIALGCFIVGIILHYMFCVDTQLNRYIFGTSSSLAQARANE
jgi:hypothetical protein